MSIGFLIEMLFNVIRGFLFKSEKAAPYAKWLLRIRDYLNLLFPTETYPANSTDDATLKTISVDPVPVAAVKKAAKTGGFNIPFIRGM